MDEPVEDESTGDESSEDESAEDKSAEDKSTEDESTEDESTEDESTEDESTEDKSTEDKSAEDEPFEEAPRLRTIADYQFGAGAGAALFPRADDLECRRTSTGRPQQVIVDGERLVSYGTDGRFTLGVAGGRRLQRALDPPAYRVVVDDESEPFVREGKNVFAKFVVDVDPQTRPGDEVLVVHERGDLLAVGRAEHGAEAIRDFETGMAVSVRESVPSTEE